MFNEAEFPRPGTLRDKFAWRVVVSPLPQADDFRVSLQGDETDRIKDEIERHVRETVAESVKDLWQLLYDAISHVVERLKDADAIFRDSLLGNVRELCDVLPKLNLLDDPHLEAARKEILAQVVSQDPEMLRKNKRARKQTAEAAAKILDGMKAFMGPAA